MKSFSKISLAPFQTASFPRLPISAGRSGTPSCLLALWTRSLTSQDSGHSLRARQTPIPHPAGRPSLTAALGSATAHPRCPRAPGGPALTRAASGLGRRPPGGTVTVRSGGRRSGVAGAARRRAQAARTRASPRSPPAAGGKSAGRRLPRGGRPEADDRSSAACLAAIKHPAPGRSARMGCPQRGTGSTATLLRGPGHGDDSPGTRMDKPKTTASRVCTNGKR